MPYLSYDASRLKLQLICGNCTFLWIWARVRAKEWMVEHVHERVSGMTQVMYNLMHDIFVAGINDGSTSKLPSTA